MVACISLFASLACLGDNAYSYNRDRVSILFILLFVSAIAIPMMILCHVSKKLSEEKIRVKQNLEKVLHYETSQRSPHVTFYLREDIRHVHVPASHYSYFAGSGGSSNIYYDAEYDTSSGTHSPHYMLGWQDDEEAVEDKHRSSYVNHPEVVDDEGELGRTTTAVDTGDRTSTVRHTDVHTETILFIECHVLLSSSSSSSSPSSLTEWVRPPTSAVAVLCGGDDDTTSRMLKSDDAGGTTTTSSSIIPSTGSAIADTNMASSTTTSAPVVVASPVLVPVSSSSVLLPMDNSTSCSTSTRIQDQMLGQQQQPQARGTSHSLVPNTTTTRRTTTSHPTSTAAAIATSTRTSTTTKSSATRTKEGKRAIERLQELERIKPFLTEEDYNKKKYEILANI